MLVASAALSFVIAWLVVRLLLSRFGRFALDEPNARSLHERPVPRSGGLALLAGAGAGAGLAAGGAELWLPLFIAAALAAVSFMDDLYRIPTVARFAAHLAAAAALVWYVLTPMAALEMLLLILAVAWITNLYNFMDGSDGLAGGMALIGFGAYAAAAQLGGHAALAACCASLAAAAGAFLLFNFHPARIFLGDVGSIPLGFLAAGLGIVGWRDDLWPLWFPVLVFGPFIGDATITLVKRLVRGARVWQAHREHYYQRLVLMGLGHRRTAWTAYALMLLCALVALGGRQQAPWLQAALFFGACALLAAVAVWTDLRWARHARAPESAA